MPAGARNGAISLFQLSSLADCRGRDRVSVVRGGADQPGRERTGLRAEHGLFCEVGEAYGPTARYNVG